MRTLTFLIICALLALGVPPVAALDLAGTVERLQGGATAIGSNGFSRPLQEGSTILVGDRITTGAAARLRLRMNDGALLTLGNSSTLTIDAYDESEATGRAVLGVVEGAFLAATGAIARGASDRFVVNTPVATIGIRGTEVWGEQVSNRLAVAMLSGTGVVVSTPDGVAELTTPEDGVDVVLGEALSAPKRWGKARLAAAIATVSFD
jgi:Uncharacterized protein conserved in bacteria